MAGTSRRKHRWKTREKRHEKNTQKRNEKTQRKTTLKNEIKKTTRETQRKTTREAALTQPSKRLPTTAEARRAEGGGSPPARHGARVAISAFKEAPRVTRGRAVACMASGSAALLPVYSSTHPPASPTSIPLPERLSPRLPVRFSFLLLPCLSTCHPSLPLHIPKRPAWLLAIRPCRPTYLSGPINQPYVHACLFIHLHVAFFLSLTLSLCLHSHL